MSNEYLHSVEETAHDTADHCLSCTSCIAGCPVTAACHDYRGPKLVGPAHERMHFSGDDVEDSLDFCSNCKNCDISCPSGVAVSTLNMLHRGEYYRTHPHPRRDEMLAHGERMAKLVRALPFGATFANLGMKIGGSLGIMASMGIAKRPLPAYASESFKSLFAKIQQPQSSKKVVFYPGCYINDNEPQVGVAFVKVMNANGYEVLLDKGFNCCGSPMVVTGYLDEAREHAQNNVARLLDWQRQGIPVVCCCTSCSLMLKQEYFELFDEPNMKKAGQNVYDSFEFLRALDERGELKENFQTVNHKYLYHVPCHLRAQGIGLPALGILRRIPGLKVETADAGCCGMSGNYGFKGDKYEISMKIGEKLFRRVRESGAEETISDCGTCRIQLQQGANAKTKHPIEVLAAAYAK